MKLKIILLITLFNTLFTLGQDDSVVLNWQFGKLGNDLGKAGILALDVDGDGKDEIITTANSTSQFSSSVDRNYFMSVLKFNGVTNQYETFWLSGTYFYEITALATSEKDKNGSFKIFLGFENGDIAVYDSLKQVELWKTTDEYTSYPPYTYSVNDIILGDIDNDLEEDIIAISKTETFIYDFEYNLKKTLPYGSNFVTLGDIDSDGRQETVYSNGQILQIVGEVIDDEFKLNKYVLSESVSIEFEDFNGDNTIDLVYSSRDTLYAFDYKNKVEIWNKKWESDNHHIDIGHIWLSDHNEDGVKDVIIGDSFNDGIYAYNGINGNLEFDLFNFPIFGITNLVVGNFDDDNNRELVWTHGVNLSGVDELFVNDFVTKNEEWRSRLITNNFNAFDVGDIDNDGELEIISANFSYDDGSYISVFDGTTKTIENQNIEPLSSFNNGITSLKVGDIDNDGINDLLAGVSFGASRSSVYVLDTNDYSIIRSFQIDGMSIIMDVAIEDIDLDGLNEVIVTTGTNVSGSSNSEEWQNYIYIFNGVTGEIEWQSPQIAGVGSKVGSIKIGNIDQDEALEVVTFLYSNFGISSKLLVIDGVSYDFVEAPMDVNAVELTDYNEDGIDEILVGSRMGKLSMLNGVTLELAKEYPLDLNSITSLEVIDLNNDAKEEFVLSDTQKLYVYDTSKEKIVWQSTGISQNDAGQFDSFIASDLDANANIDFIFNGGHALYNFEVIDFDALDQKLVLPPDNFSVRVIGETCENKDNGQILITAIESYSYSAELNDEFFNFDEVSLEINSLKPGDYNLCVYVNGYDYQQCFDIAIPSSESISGKTTLSSKKVVFQIQTGTQPYSLFKNGEKMFETSNMEFSVSVENDDLIEVKSAFECEGTLSEKVSVEGALVLFPNPTQGEFKVGIKNPPNKVDIEIYDLQSRLVHQQNYPIVNGYLSMEILGIPAGTYILKILGDKPITRKIIKQ